MTSYINEWSDKIIQALPNLLTAILIFVAAIYLAKLLSNLLRKFLESRKADKEVTLLLAELTRWGILVVGAITALQRFFDVTAFLAGLGILGFTVGFALQDITQNFVAGVILLLQQPFNVGDAVDISGYSGTVLSINLRTTEIRAWDGRVIILPNASILSNAIVNYTRASRRRIELPLGIGYNSDLERAKQAILRALESVPGFVETPAPNVVFHTFGESSIDLTAYFWIDTTKAGLFEAKDAALRLVKAAMDREGIDIPYPVRTIYIEKQ
jgi:small-conductance mechanosensitive channel